MVTRVIRWAGGAAASTVAVAGLRVLLGPWAAAVVLAAAGMAGLLAGWATVEARAFDRRRPVIVRGGPARGDHVAFARALATVATAYLAECEREADR
jgi:hypothetical protein